MLLQKKCPKSNTPVHGDLRESPLERSGSTALPLFNPDTVEVDTLGKGFHPSSVCPIAGIRLDIGFDPIAIGDMASKCRHNRTS